MAAYTSPSTTAGAPPAAARSIRATRDSIDMAGPGDPDDLRPADDTMGHRGLGRCRGNRLKRTMWWRAAIPSRHVIFLPSS